MAFQTNLNANNVTSKPHDNLKGNAPSDALTFDGSTPVSSRSYGLQNNPLAKAQSNYVEMPQPSIPQTVLTQFIITENTPTSTIHAVPSRCPFPQPVLHPFSDNLNPLPLDTFATSEPFRASYGDESMQGIATGPQGAMSQPPNGPDFPNHTAPPAGWSHTSTQPAYSTLDSQSQYQHSQSRAYPFPNVSETQIQNRQPPLIPPPMAYDPRRPLSRKAYTQPIPMPSPFVQPQAPAFPVPSLSHPPTDATVRLDTCDTQYQTSDPAYNLDSSSPILISSPASAHTSPNESNLDGATTYDGLGGDAIPPVTYPPYPLPDSQNPQYPYSLTSLLPDQQSFVTAMTHVQPCTQSPTAVVTQGSSVDSESDPVRHWHEVVLTFLLVTFPEQAYLNCLLRLPFLYVSRVARIIEETDISLPEMEKVMLEMVSKGITQEDEIQMAFESANGTPAYKRLISTWETFIDSVMREWKVLNIISVLLLSAILTILQIEDAAKDPLTRYAALLSLVCSLISLLFGCMYIIRWGGMRRAQKAAEWAHEAKETNMNKWWNVYILLAMPAIWLTWSIICYIVCIMSFIWRSGAASPAQPPAGLSEKGLLALRISITIVFGIGLVYGSLILATFKRYGAIMDKAAKRRINRYIQEFKATENIIQPALDDPPYPFPRPYSGHSTMHQPHTSSCYTTSDDANDRYSHSPANPSQTIVPSPDRSHTDWPRRSSDTLNRANMSTINASNFHNRAGTAPAAYFPNPRATPSLRPRKKQLQSMVETVNA